RTGSAPSYVFVTDMGLPIAFIHLRYQSRLALTANGFHDRLPSKPIAGNKGEIMFNWNAISATREAFALRIGLAALGGLVMALLVDRLQAIQGDFQPLTATVVSTIALSLFLLWAGAGVMRRLPLLIWMGAAISAIA